MSAAEMAGAEVLRFIVTHPELIRVAREAVQCGCTEEGIVAAIKAEMTRASDAAMAKELGK